MVIVSRLEKQGRPTNNPLIEWAGLLEKCAELGIVKNSKQARANLKARCLEGELFAPNALHAVLANAS